MDMAECLRQRGYRVLEAGTAKEAITVFQTDVVDLVFTDINLSEGMNGLELAEWTLLHWPGVKVLVTTGDSSRAANIPPTIESFLAKPYTDRELADRINQALPTRSG